MVVVFATASVRSQNHFRDDKGWNSANLCWFRFDSPRPKWNRGRSRWVFAIRASALDSTGNDDASVPVDGKGLDWERRINSFREMVNALPPATLVVSSCFPFAFGFFRLRQVMNPLVYALIYDVLGNL